MTIITTENSFIDWLIVTFKPQRAAQLTRSTRKDPMVSRLILKLIKAEGNYTKLTATELFSSRFRFSRSDAVLKRKM